MGPILELVTGDGKRLVDVMHLHLFRPTLAGVNVGVVSCIDPHLDRDTPLPRPPFVTMRCWDSREELERGVGYTGIREDNGMAAWYVSRDAALKAHVGLVQKQANAMVQKALESIGK